MDACKIAKGKGFASTLKSFAAEAAEARAPDVTEPREGVKPTDKATEVRRRGGGTRWRLSFSSWFLVRFRPLQELVLISFIILHQHLVAYESITSQKYELTVTISRVTLG